MTDPATVRGLDGKSRPSSPGVPKALGLTVEDWVQKRLGGYVRMSIDERREAVKELSEQGMSEREIASVVGVSDTTVHRALASNEAIEPHPAADFASNEAEPINAVAALAADEKVRTVAHQAAKREVGHG